MRVDVYHRAAVGNTSVTQRCPPALPAFDQLEFPLRHNAIRRASQGEIDPLRYKEFQRHATKAARCVVTEAS